MKLKELLEQYSDVELTKEQEKQVKDYLGIKDKKLNFNEGEKYFYIDSYGDIDYNLFAEADGDIKYRLFTNNCFKTKEEAEFRLKQIIVYNELKNFADENNDEIDWKNEDSVKYYFYLSHDCNGILIDYAIFAQDLGNIYFSSQELAEQAIKKVGADRIKKYLFGVGVNA